MVSELGFVDPKYVSMVWHDGITTVRITTTNGKQFEYNFFGANPIKNETGG